MDRRTLLGALGLALAAPLGSALAAEPPKYTRPGRVYNKNGAYEGRMDSSGRMYDQSGRYVGREDSSGRRYDASGRSPAQNSRTSKNRYSVAEWRFYCLDARQLEWFSLRIRFAPACSPTSILE